MKRRSLRRRGAVALLLFLALPLAAYAAADGPPSRGRTDPLGNRWQAAVRLLASVELAGLVRALLGAGAPEPPAEESEEKLPPPSPNLGADMDPNG